MVSNPKQSAQEDLKLVLNQPLNQPGQLESIKVYCSKCKQYLLSGPEGSLTYCPKCFIWTTAKKKVSPKKTSVTIKKVKTSVTIRKAQEGA